MFVGNLLPWGAKPVSPREILRCPPVPWLRGKRDGKPTALRLSIKSLLSTVFPEESL